MYHIFHTTLRRILMLWCNGALQLFSGSNTSARIFPMTNPWRLFRTSDTCSYYYIFAVATDLFCRQESHSPSFTFCRNVVESTEAEDPFHSDTALHNRGVPMISSLMASKRDVFLNIHLAH